MSIEQEYLDKIEEIKQNDDKLSAWEKGFIYGDDDSTPIDTRPTLSISQKNVVDRIYDQRIKGVKQQPLTEIKFDASPRVIANKLETGTFGVSIDGKRMGPNVSQREATAIVGWLAEIIDELCASNCDKEEPAPF
tara:strand:- start:732 stop:1136 length:405 start_codon:yes stop_codon:yes gene_type:complete